MKHYYVTGILFTTSDALYVA